MSLHGLDEDTRAIAGLARDFARREVAPAARAWDVAERLPASPLRALGELGLLGLMTPEGAGGAGLGATQLVAVVAELAEASGALAWVVAETAVAGRILAEAGLDDVLEGVLSGRLRLGVADGADGVGGVIDPVSLAATAERLLVVGEERVALVDPSGAGVTRVAHEGALGLRGLELGRVEAPVAAWRVATGLGADAAGAWRRLRRLGAAAVALGLGRAAVEQAARYATTRVQFGRPIADFQAVSFKVADAATELDGAALTLRDAAAAFDGAAVDAGVAVDEAKLLATTAASLAADEALQIHGGYGYTRDYPVERLWRDARACACLAGTAEELLVALAGRLDAATA